MPPKNDQAARVVFKCNCLHNDGLPCYTAFDPDVLENARLQYCMPWMTKEERDIAVLAKIESGIHMEEQTCSTRQVNNGRKSTRIDFFFRGRPICRDIFFLLHSIGKQQFYALKKQYLENGVEPRIHGLSKRSPRHALSYDNVQRIVQFIVNYADTHAITLPGRSPRHWKADAALLPTSTTKRVVYAEYKKVLF